MPSFRCLTKMKKNTISQDGPQAKGLIGVNISVLSVLQTS